MKSNPPHPLDIGRRRFVTGLAAGGVAAGLGLWRGPAWAATGQAAGAVPVLTGTDFDLSIGTSPVNFTGRTRPAMTVNGSLPAPILRWRQGDTVTLRVANRLTDAMTSIHWHGILLPANMDGVPGMSFDGIHPGETYQYRFQLKQSGTYWYHSHSLFQEQAGLYGAIVIDPIEPLPYAFDREHVVLLSDWTDLDPGALFRRLKKFSEYDNYYKPTVGDFIRDVRRMGLAETIEDRKMWGEMRMTPTDISDVNAHTYTYLMNGAAPGGNWTGLFRSGEKVLLRFINGSAMTYFDVRIPGLKMTVVAADGLPIHPVSVDEFRIAVAETFDVIVEPSGQDAFTIFAQDMGRTGYARGTLAVRHGLEAPIPARDPRPLLTMADMGHGGHDMSAMKGMEGGCGASMGHGGHDMHGGGAMQSHPASEDGNPLIDMQTMTPEPKLHDPGIGLRDNGRKVLTYGDMRSLFQDPDGREPGREIELHLTGHMEKFAWSFNGRKFMDAEPLRLNYGERMRIVLVNDTMMTHPIHLHGVWSDVEDENGEFMVRKHTVDMPPGTKRSYRVRADALGRWAYHCHLLYHMEAGMMREVRIEE
ncbi:copper resistance system multicopper oxidase [Novilysobacter selenitireducens]|uniref:Copper resistance system multicopper oxidase n=1 Tax=Novilysobacter selenitireducens TaxID=2872639 RepID=A0ABS7T5H1_9GAMM|nr:copper resistance system multicopper oxidase [Lysobacter selenitireducens]MBZ4039129.1 copper resistance system multicopper oxidase [Lysobacter selenitireducens]